MARKLVRYRKFCRDNDLNPDSGYHLIRQDRWPGGLHRIGGLLYVDPEAFFASTRVAPDADRDLVHV